MNAFVGMGLAAIASRMDWVIEQGHAKDDWTVNAAAFLP